MWRRRGLVERWAVAVCAPAGFVQWALPLFATYHTTTYIHYPVYFNSFIFIRDNQFVHEFTTHFNNYYTLIYTSFLPIMKYNLSIVCDEPINTCKLFLFRPSTTVITMCSIIPNILCKFYHFFIIFAVKWNETFVSVYNCRTWNNMKVITVYCNKLIIYWVLRT